MVRLTIVSGPDQGSVFELVDGQFRLGRDHDCEIRLSDGSVSRQHALLTVSGSACHIADLGSRHGVLVNGVRAQTADLGPSDVVQLGQTQLTVSPASAPSPSGPGLPPTLPQPKGVRWGRNCAIFAAVLLVLLMAGCIVFGLFVRSALRGGGLGAGFGGLIVSEGDVQKIENGMTHEQVRDILGEPVYKIPEGIETEDAPEIWRYGTVDVEFRDGAVVRTRKTAATAPGGG